MKLEELLNVVTGKVPLLRFEDELWHVERLEIEQTDAVHRPTTQGGELNRYETRIFEATLRLPSIRDYARTKDIGGLINTNGDLIFPVRFPTDEDMQRQELMDERI
jgi:hypothetical protein